MVVGLDNPSSVGGLLIQTATHQVMGGQELGDDVVAKEVRDPAGVAPPSVDARVRVGPQQVAEDALVGHVHGAGQLEDLGEVAELRGEAAVHAEDLGGGGGEGRNGEVGGRREGGRDGLSLGGLSVEGQRVLLVGVGRFA